MMKRRFYSNTHFIFRALIIGIVVIVVFGTAIKLLWNWLIPSIFGLSVISFWQAIGLFLLTRILFGHSWWSRQHEKFHKNEDVRKRWMNMTPEQREEFMKRRREFRHKGQGPWQGQGFGRRNSFFNNDDDKKED